MRTTNRNRPDYRSTALGLITLLLAVLLLVAPAAATGNTAAYEVSANGSLYTADISFTNLDKFYLVSPGFFFGLGGDEAMKGVSGLTLTNKDNGSAITPVNTKGTLTFPKGNYTLTYTAPVKDGVLYVKYPVKFNASITMHDPYTTGHIVLGPVDKTGVISKTGTDTKVTYTGIEKASIRIYNKNREYILYGFVAVWGVIVLILFLRHQNLKKKQMKTDD